MGVLDTLGAATTVRKTETLYLDGAAQAEWESTFLELEDAALADDAPDSGASMADHAPNTRAVVEKLEAIRERMKASEVTFLFEQIGWTKRLALQADHPPRDGNLVDQLRGHNIETYTAAIIKASCVSVTDGAGDTATDIPDDLWDKLLGWRDDDGTEHAGTLNLKQVDTLLKAAVETNDQETRVPTSARSLLQSQDSGASSAPPSPGKSPRSGSAAGSRRTSRKSTTTKKAASSGS